MEQNLETRARLLLTELEAAQPEVYDSSKSTELIGEDTLLKIKKVSDFYFKIPMDLYTALKDRLEFFVAGTVQVCDEKFMSFRYNIGGDPIEYLLKLNLRVTYLADCIKEIFPEHGSRLQDIANGCIEATIKTEQERADPKMNDFSSNDL